MSDPAPPYRHVAFQQSIGRSLLQDPDEIESHLQQAAERVIKDALALLDRGELASPRVTAVGVYLNVAAVPAVPAEEVMALFRSVLAGGSAMEPRDVPWDEDGGDMRFAIDGYEVVIFNDCDDLDYVERVTAPDGRRSEHEDWAAHGGDPSHRLTEPERAALLAHIRGLRP